LTEAVSVAQNRPLWRLLAESGATHCQRWQWRRAQHFGRNLNCSNYILTVQALLLKLEGTHRVRTHAVIVLTLTLMLTFDFSTQNHVTFGISQGHSLYQVWTLWDYSLWSYSPDITEYCDVDLWTPTLSYAPDKPTDGLQHPTTDADRHSRRG